MEHEKMRANADIEAACEESITVAFLDGVAVINNLIVRNHDAVELLKRMEPGEAGALVVSLLTTVAKVAEGATTAEVLMAEFRERIQAETRREFQEFKQAVVEEFGTASEELGRGLKELGEGILEELKRSDGQLGERVDLKLKELREMIEARVAEKQELILRRFAVEEKEAEIRGKTTLMGLDFQEAVYHECRELLKGTEDVVEFTADTPGVMKRKTGDIVVHYCVDERLKPGIVIECKDMDMGGSGGVGAVMNEVKEAVANREADACLYLFRDEGQMPVAFRPFKVGRDYVVASMDIELGVLLNLAKLVGALESKLRSEEGEVDLERARMELRGLIARLKDFDEMRRLCKLSMGHMEKVHTMAGKLRKEIERGVDKILQGLTAPSDKFK
jgi:hypothetical protein